METTLHDSLPDLADLLLDAVFLVDTDGQIVHVSAACEGIFGYTPAEMIGRPMINFVAHEDRARTVAEAAHVMGGRPRVGFENRYIRKDGRHVHIMWSARWSQADRLRIGVARDITRLRQAEHLQAATYAVSEAVHNAVDLATLFREIHHIVASLVPSAAFAIAIWDVTTKQFEFPYQMDLHGNARIMEEADAHRYCREALHSGGQMLLSEDLLVVPLTTREQAVGALMLRSQPGTIYSEKDKELLHFVSAQVATAIVRGQLNAELVRLARYDELTGLPNRRLFHDRMKAVLAKCRRKQTRMAVLFVDINGFKQVNDAHGHAVGDRLLAQIAHRLKSCVREEDTVARIGGDEFVVMLEEVRLRQDAAVVADKIRGALREPIRIDGLVLTTRASIGLALYPDHGADTEQLLKHADHAMYAEKEGKDLAAG